jgi:hypothetical protein
LYRQEGNCADVALERIGPFVAAANSGAADADALSAVTAT